PFFGNGEIYALDRFVIGRDPTNEDMTLDLWFRPSEYYTVLATNMSLKEPALRKSILLMWIGLRQSPTSRIPLGFPVPFTPKDVIAFAYAHQPFTPGPTLYYA